MLLKMFMSSFSTEIFSVWDFLGFYVPLNCDLLPVLKVFGVVKLRANFLCSLDFNLCCNNLYFSA